VVALELLHLWEGGSFPLLSPRRPLPASGGSRHRLLSGVRPGVVQRHAAPLASRYYEVSASADTSCLIVANLNDATALDPQPPQYPYAFTLSRSANDEAFEPVGGILLLQDVIP